MNIKKKSIPLSIWVIGIASGLLNITSCLIFSLSGIFLNSRGITIDWISTLEHTVEALSYIMKVLSGVISDFFKKRKTIILIGFGLSMLSRPLLAMGVTFFAATAAFVVMFIARIMERLANGLQSTPRDALVADLSPHEIKGECFGLRQTLTTAGSFIGAGLGMYWMHVTSNNYEKIFWFATIPPIIAFVILYFFVKDAPTKNTTEESIIKQHQQNSTPFDLKNSLSRLGKAFWSLMIVVSVFMLARVSESILGLHALKTYGLPEQWVPFVCVIYNIATSMASYPIGRLSDRIPRVYVLLAGCACLVIADILLSFSSSLFILFIGIAIWGIQIGVTQSMFLALIADHVPEDLRGTAFGLFYLFCALSIFIAGVYGGYISKVYSISIMYMISGLIACFAIASLLFVNKCVLKKCQKNNS